MIPFLPDLPTTTGPLAALPGAATVAGGARTVPDFAGLLDAAMPARITLPSQSALPDAAIAPMPAVPSVPTAMADVAPSGTILPESGTALPPFAALVPTPVARPNIAAAPAPEAALVPTTRSGDEVAEPETPDEAESADSAADEGDVLEAVPTAAPAPTPAQAPAQAPAPTPVSAAPATALVLAPPPAPAPAAMAAARTVPVAGPVAMRVATNTPLAPRLPAATGEPVGDDTPAEQLAPALPDDLAETVTRPAVSASSGTAASQSAPHAPIAPPPAAGPAPVTDRAEPRAPAPQLESAIAQVGEIREALRSARPEMTLRHAEFGFVSLRIEAAAASQDWRAVLASRDPGFVPAIQAALAERGVAPSADTAATGAGTGQGSGSSGSSDRTYGFSQGSGQGSSQPYLAHSGNRDEGASQHQHQRQQQRRDDAALAGGTQDNEATDHRQRGLFA